MSVQPITPYREDNDWSRADVVAALARFGVEREPAIEYQRGAGDCSLTVRETRCMNSASRTRLGSCRGRPQQCFAFEANEPSPRAHGQAPIIQYFPGLLIELRHLGIEFLFCLGYATLLLHHPTPLMPSWRLYSAGQLSSRMSTARNQVLSSVTLSSISRIESVTRARPWLRIASSGARARNPERVSPYRRRWRRQPAESIAVSVLHRPHSSSSRRQASIAPRDVTSLTRFVFQLPSGHGPARPSPALHRE